MKKNLKSKICGTIFLVLGMAFAIVGLYYYHMQYLCFEYTPLQFILGVGFPLGERYFPYPLAKKQIKRKKH